MTHPLAYNLPAHATHPTGTSPGDEGTAGGAGAGELVLAEPWMETFLRGLRAMPNVTSAAKLAGISHTHVYRVRSADPVFAAAWDDALEQAYDVLENYAHRMSTEGLEVTESKRTVTRQLVDGRLVVVEEREESRTSRFLSPHMAQFLLRAARPKKFTQPARFEHSAPGGGPVQHEVLRPLDQERALELARITLELAAADVIEGDAEDVEDADYEPVANGSGGIRVE